MRDPGWSLAEVYRATGVHVTGPDDDAGIRAAQFALGVRGDGMFGPGSIAALHRQLGYSAHTFEGRPRAGGRPSGVTCLMLHHSVTYTHDRLIQVLRARRLSTHYSIEPDGTLHELCDPDLMTRHAGAWNRCSIGIDVISPYEPRYYRAGGPWAAPVSTGGQWGSRSWAGLRRSVIPDTPEAIATLRRLIAELCARYSLAPTWPEPGKRLSLDPRAEAQPFGVLAHGTVDTNRWDGWGALMSLASE